MNADGSLWMSAPGASTAKGAANGCRTGREAPRPATPPAVRRGLGMRSAISPARFPTASRTALEASGSTFSAARWTTPFRPPLLARALATRLTAPASSAAFSLALRALADVRTFSASAVPRRASAPAPTRPRPGTPMEAISRSSRVEGACFSSIAACRASWRALASSPRRSRSSRWAFVIPSSAGSVVPSGVVKVVDVGSRSWRSFVGVGAGAVGTVRCSRFVAPLRMLGTEDWLRYGPATSLRFRFRFASGMSTWNRLNGYLISWCRSW